MSVCQRAIGRKLLEWAQDLELLIDDLKVQKGTIRIKMGNTEYQQQKNYWGGHFGYFVFVCSKHSAYNSVKNMSTSCVYSSNCHQTNCTAKM